MFSSKSMRSILAHSWSLSWPMTLIMFCVFVIGLTDVYIAGKFGKEIQAAYGLVFQVYFIFSIVASALSVGSVSVISRLFSSGESRHLTDAVDSSCILSLVAGILAGAAGYFFSPQIIAALRVPEVLKGHAVVFMRIYSLGIVFNYILLNSNAILRACGMVQKSLLTMTIVCVLNVVLNFFFAFGSPLGYQGIAVATLVSTVVGGVLNFIYLRVLMSTRVRFLKEIARKIIVISWPAGILQILWQVGAMVLFLIIAVLPRQAIEIMAAFTNGLKVEAAIFLPAFAFNMANAVVVGNLLGKKQKDEAYAAGLVTACVGVGIVSVMSVVVMMNARWVASWLSDNPVVISECMRYIYISLLFEPLMAWGVILAGGLNGAGDTKSVMIAVTTSVWLIRIPISYFFAIHLGFGAAAIWWSMNASILVQSFFITRRYLGRRWMVS
ncbi:MAG TPA: MATE family efflux transporter [Candidatus Omnitrophota bacterium]|nr:MATE family efflux transporter [Candidatus Omnitrophota bacterium]HPT06585.1 MATE family efflux transporter [Candidatus Omnitrophota bacterium]